MECIIKYINSANRNINCEFVLDYDNVYRFGSVRRKCWFMISLFFWYTSGSVRKQFYPTRLSRLLSCGRTWAWGLIGAIGPNGLKPALRSLVVQELQTHSAHFIYDYMASDIWLRINSDSERGNPLPPLHGLLFSISSKESFICTIPHTG